MMQTGAAPVGAIIMAAGAGRRMGNVPKSLLLRDGEPLLLRQARIAAGAGARTITVVLGHHADRLAAVLQQSLASAPDRYAGATISWTLNPTPDDGTASSLRHGLATLPPDLPVYLVMLGDQPLLEAGDVEVMLDAWQTRAPGIQLVVPQHAQRLGHPVAFGPELYRHIAQAPDNQGIREWRQAHPQHVSILQASHPRYTTDVDTPADLDRLRDAHGIQLETPGPERTFSGA